MYTGNAGVAWWGVKGLSPASISGHLWTFQGKGSIFLGISKGDEAGAQKSGLLVD
jgi:hypothetical protein